VSSARYEVLREQWKGKDGQKVNIEIFHDTKHTYNTDRYVKSVKASLDYFGTNFSPYQYTQLRVLEFPRYASFAQSFPNTVPYSEGFGWVADFSDVDDTDYAFYVTSHEVAHQWWGHQITPSYTRGANQISETMAEYSALMVLKKEYGKDVMQRFLRYALDSYLRGRASESKFEDNLLENESRAYVWYYKGSIILYALQDLVGEDRLNKGFAKFLKNAAFRQKPPFATSREWYSYIKEVTPDSLQYFLEDSFEKITLYENKITEAKATDLKNGTYKLKLKVNTKKIYYDGQGNATGEGKGKDYIDIGIFTEDGKNKSGMKKKIPLYLEKHALSKGEHIIEIVVKGKPLKAGIDPYNKLIDRVPDDNLIDVDLK
jgi:aminopeptidase N